MELPDAYVNSALLHLQAAVGTARQQFEADPSNISLAQRVARLEIVQSLCKTYCLDSPSPERLVSIQDQRPAGVDGRPGAGYELAGSSSGSVPTEACAPERGRASLDELQGQYEHLSFSLGD